jgi:serine/threonine protein kinase
MTDVAVKVLSIADPAMLGNRPNAMQQAVDSFMAEVQLLSQLRHPNVVLFMAMSRMPNGEVAVLTEFCPLGSLFDLLHNGSASSLAALTMKVRLKMAIDIARGMTYLHSQKPPMIHQDLKSMNVLVCEGYTCKVADFGMSIPKSSHRPVTCTGGTPFYLAPETMAEGKVSEKSDVYAFAVVLFELLVRETPFPQLARATVDIIRAKVLEGVRPCPQTPAGQRDWDLHPSVVEIIQRCWHPQSAMRPSFAEIIPLLQGAAASMR